MLAVKAGVLADYQLARFRAFTDPSLDLQGAAYNVNQARIAIAHGGLFGQGLFHGAQTQGGFVPEQQTDFIFSVAGEELGFVGGAAIIALYAVLLWRVLRIAYSADRIGRLLCAGVVCWFAFQAFQNIGMNLGLTPVTGLPLPFVSYGGSSMFARRRGDRAGAVGGEGVLSADPEHDEAVGDQAERNQAGDDQSEAGAPASRGQVRPELPQPRDIRIGPPEHPRDDETERAEQAQRNLPPVVDAGPCDLEGLGAYRFQAAPGPLVLP